MLVPDTPHEFFQDVFQRNQTNYRAIGLLYNGLMEFARLETPKLCIYFFISRDKVRGSYDLFQRFYFFIIY